MARHKRRQKRDSRGRFAKSARAAGGVLKRNTRVGRVGPGHAYHGVKVSGTRTVKGKVAVYGSVSVGVRRIA